MTAFFPKLDLSAFLPAVDMTAFFPKLDLSAFLPDFQALLEDLRRSRPPNWPPGINLDRVAEVIRDDGLPLVWVPRAELVQEVVDAEDRGARVTVLLAHASELVQDCRGVLHGVTHAAFTGQQQLAERCVEALEQGHHEAAQALAVAVTETAVSRTLSGNYAKVKQQVLFNPDLVPYTQLRLRAALAPIHRFYTDWSPKSPHPAPEAISRHVSVHHADPATTPRPTPSSLSCLPARSLALSRSCSSWPRPQDRTRRQPDDDRQNPCADVRRHRGSRSGSSPRSARPASGLSGR